MWKYSVFNKSVKSVKRTYSIKGLNLDNLLNTARNRGIDLFDVKKIARNRMLVSVNLTSSEKFFAIAKELCYNIKKVRDKGKGYPLFVLVKNCGLIIGAIIFIVCSIYFNDRIFAISFSGSGSIYDREVKNYLSSIGVKEYSKFSDINIGALGDRITENNDRLSFATCEKRGNTLKVKLVLSAEKVKTLSGNVYEMYSDVDGVIESVKVYRGTALKNAGDTVKKGELIVGGFSVIKEQTVKINLLATVSIITESNFIYRSDKSGQEDIARLFAEQIIYGRDIVDGETTVKEENGTFIYTTTLRCRRIISAG